MTKYIYRRLKSHKLKGPFWANVCDWNCMIQYINCMDKMKQKYETFHFIQWLDQTYAQSITDVKRTFTVMQCADCFGAASFSPSFLKSEAICLYYFKKHYKDKHKELYQYVWYVNNILHLF